MHKKGIVLLAVMLSVVFHWIVGDVLGTAAPRFPDRTPARVSVKANLVVSEIGGAAQLDSHESGEHVDAGLAKLAPQTSRRPKADTFIGRKIAPHQVGSQGGALPEDIVDEATLGFRPLEADELKSFIRVEVGELWKKRQIPIDGLPAKFVVNRANGSLALFENGVQRTDRFALMILDTVHVVLRNFSHKEIDLIWPLEFEMYVKT